MYTFRELVQIFESYPKAHTIGIFCDLFVRFNVMIEKPLLHVLTAGIALVVGIHKAYGQRVMATLLKCMIEKYKEISQEE